MRSAKLSEHIVVPVANESDARSTAAALEAYRFGQATVVHVVEKGDGVPDKTPVEQSEQIATEAFQAFRDTFPAAETELVYDRDVVKGITDVAATVGASAIVFQPLPGGRLQRFLAGDRSLRLITEAERPVIALHGGDR